MNYFVTCVLRFQFIHYRRSQLVKDNSHISQRPKKGLPLLTLFVTQIIRFMGPTRGLPAPGGPHVSPTNLAIRESWLLSSFSTWKASKNHRAIMGLIHHVSTIIIAINGYQHNGAWTKWLTSCREHFQMHLLEWKYLYFDSNNTEIYSQRPNKE